eukprot:9495775-Pyramimonas_sp.AAC.1
MEASILWGRFDPASPEGTRVEGGLVAQASFVCFPCQMPNPATGRGARIARSLALLCRVPPVMARYNGI